MSGWEALELNQFGFGRRLRFHAYSDVLAWIGPHPQKRVPSLPAEVHPLAQARLRQQSPTAGFVLLWNDGVIEYGVPFVPGLPELHPTWIKILADLKLNRPATDPGNRMAEERQQRERWFTRIFHRKMPPPTATWIEDESEPGSGVYMYTDPGEAYSLVECFDRDSLLSVVYEGKERPGDDILDRDFYTYTVGFTHHLARPGVQSIRAALQIGPCRDLPFGFRSRPAESLMGMAMRVQDVYNLEIGLRFGMCLSEGQMAEILARILNRQDQEGKPPTAKVIPVTATTDYDFVLDVYEADREQVTCFEDLEEEELPPGLRLLVWETLGGLDDDGNAALKLRQIEKFASLPFQQ